ncbi:MAG: hypothetical protein PUB58_02805, partial [Clostridiales bacterium]|nr:hypothetical protein [Clostridiales bacterium]
MQAEKYFSRRTCRRKKMIEFSFAAPAAKLCEAFFTILVQGAGLLPEFLLCKKHSKLKMCHFLAPSGQPKMMHKTSR